MEIDASKIGINPFSHSLELKASQFKGEGYIGEPGSIRIPKRYNREQTPNCKIFITAELRKITMGLSNNSLRIYLWLVFHAEPERDYIKFNRSAYMKENAISSVNTVKTGLAELIRYQFIEKSNVKNVYWFNPLYFFRGDRLKKYPKKVAIIHSLGI
jgi:hypothetical protein